MRFQNNVKPLQIMAALITLTSLVQCEKVIDLDLGTAAPKIVIEGNISNAEERHTVKISTTTDFYEEGSFHPLIGAEVIITDNMGTTHGLEETSNGIYQTSEFAGVEGRSYTLTVRNGHDEYSATSIMPSVIVIDTIFVSETTRWGETAKSVRVQFKDPGKVVNYYRFSLIRDDKPFTAKFILDDRLYDGQDINYDLVQLSEDPLEAGNHVLVHMYCIDPNVYNYFATIPSNWEPPAVPANPVSNFGNNALGYFSAQTVSTKTLMVQ
jgi:Domain of unknown function (DUF4249)